MKRIILEISLLFLLALQIKEGHCAIISLDSAVKYQTITGWEATLYAGQNSDNADPSTVINYHPGFNNYVGPLLDMAVNDIGINRIRLEIRSGTENPQDHWMRYQTGQINYNDGAGTDSWRQVRHTWINDNNDPNHINSSGFQFSELDNKINKVVTPLKQKVEANGEHLYINLIMVDFSKLNDELSSNPEEYAEFALAVFQHIDSTYGWVPDALEIALEPHHGTWNPTKLGKALVAAAKRLDSNGYTPDFIAPSHTNAKGSINWYNTMKTIPGVMTYLTEFSYHYYGGNSDVNRRTIGNIATQDGMRTAMLEWWSERNSYHILHKDLKMAYNSTWQLGTLMGIISVDETDPDNPIVSISDHSRFYRHYSKFVRAGAVRIDAVSDDKNFDALAFINKDGKYVVVVKVPVGGSFSIQNLPAGTYGAKYTTYRASYKDKPDILINSGVDLTTSIPDAGVITIFSKTPISSNNQPPIADTDQSSKEIKSTVPGAAPNFLDTPEKDSSLLQAFRSPSFIKAISRFFSRLTPGQGGIIWLSIIIIVTIAFDFKKLISRRNADLILFIILSFLFIDLIRLGDYWSLKSNPKQKSLFGFMFLGIFLINMLLLLSSFFHSFKLEKKEWIPNLPKRLLVILTVIILSSNVLVALVRFPDDCGVYINIGADRMMETKKFPYGDPSLRGGAAATYGPILYLAHIPFQLVLSDIDRNVEVDENPFLNWIVAGGREGYHGVPIMATKLTLLFFHFLAIFGLIVIGTHLRESSVGWGLACLYGGYACVQGLGGVDCFINGLSYISHVAPTALTISAFALLNRPFWAGSLLALSAGALFYPAFFFPLWLGYYFWRDKKWKNFIAGFIIISLIIITATLLLTETTESENALKVIYESTVGHQESKEAYGSSTFSFWGTHPKLAAFWQQPLIHGWYLLKPSFLLFTIFIIATFFMARGRTVTQFAFLTASIAIAVQLWKSHAGGTYVEWYYPFFLIGLLCQQTSELGDYPIEEK